MSISPAQVKAARLLLGWSQGKLASESGVAAVTIAIFEEGEQRPPLLDVSVVERMLKDGGVEFTDGTPGVKIKPRRSVEIAQGFSTHL